MMFWMTSKTFRDIFLINETDQDILDAQYVLVSTRIHKRGKAENIISAKQILCPDAKVCMSIHDDDFRERYFEQLMGERTFLATLIKASIEEKYNIILLYTPIDHKMKYLRYLEEFVHLEFHGYPVYDYKAYANGYCDIRKYNKKKVLKKCNKFILDAKKKQRKMDLKTEDGRRAIMREYKEWKTKDLKKNLKKRGLYEENMTRSDMLETMELFLD